MDKKIFAIVFLFLQYTTIIDSKDIPPTIVPHTNASAPAPPTADKTLESKNGTGISAEGKNGTGVSVAVKNGPPIQKVTLYYFDVHNFLGFPWTIEVPSCVRVPNLLYRKTSIVDTQGACMTLYSREECKGRRIVIDPKGNKDNYTSLATVQFDHTLVSLQPCNNANETHKNTGIIISTASPNKKGNMTTTSGNPADPKSTGNTKDAKPVKVPY